MDVKDMSLDAEEMELWRRLVREHIQRGSRVNSGDMEMLKQQARRDVARENKQTP